jgi:hypothetical protein
MEDADYTLLVNWTGGGTPGYPSYGVEFDGADTLGYCGSAGHLDNLHAGEFTVGIWARADGWGELNGSDVVGNLIGKGHVAVVGWKLRIHDSGGLDGVAYAVTQHAYSRSGLDDFTPDSTWHYFTMYYDDSGDRKIYLAIDGEWIAGYDLQQPAIGAVLSDSLQALCIGTRADKIETWDGCIGWAALWEGDHHGVGVNFTPPQTCPLGIDADIIEAWPFSEQTGNTAYSVVVSASYCELTDHAWTCSWRPGEDCSDDFVSANIVRGFNNPLARMATTGRATFVLNNINRQYSPALHAEVRPGAAVLFEMTYDGVTEPLFHGQIESIEPQSGQYEQLRVMFNSIDAMAKIDSVEARIPLMTDATADEIIEEVTDAIGTLLAPDYEVGINVFATSADRWIHEPAGGWGKFQRRYYTKGEAAGKILEAVTGEWGRFYIARDGTPTFINRHHMLLDDTTELTLTTPTDVGYRMAMSDVYNVIEIDCNPRSVGAPLSTLWEMTTDKPPMIDAGETISMDCKFVDPLNDAVVVGGMDCLAPVANTDYTATSDEAGDGDDKTAQVGIAATFYGDRAVLDITNNDANAIYLHMLKVRGTPIRSMTPWTALEEDAASQVIHGGRRLRIDATLMSRPYEAERLAQYLLDVYKDPHDNVTGVGFCANTAVALMEAARDLELCDRVMLTEFQTALAAYAGYIYLLTHNISGESGHWVSMNIETAYDAGCDPFRLETVPPGGGSALNSGDCLIY